MRRFKPSNAVRYSVKPATTTALCALSFTFGCSAYADYAEQGKLGNAASWRSEEFQSDWGLGVSRLTKLMLPVSPARA